MGKTRKGQLVNVGKGNIIGRCVFLLLEFNLDNSLWLAIG